MIERYQLKNNLKHCVFIKIVENNTTKFEVEFYEQDKSISEIFDTNGQLLEREEVILEANLNKQIKEKIYADLKQRYTTFKVYEIQKVFIGNSMDLELKVATDKSSTGLFEVKYDNAGLWLSEQTLKIDALQTLN